MRKMGKIAVSRSEKLFDVLNHLLMIGLCLIMLYPFVHITSIAFSTQAESLRPGLHLYPREFDSKAFLRVLNTSDLWTAYMNTLFRTVVGTVLSVLVTSMGAYVITKKYLPSRKLITTMILFTMYFNGGLIPTYMVMRGLKLLDNVWVMILPNLVWGFNIIIMKNFFQQIPESLEESARIDGASDFRIFCQIIIPLSLPVVATIALWMAVFHWNAYFDNLMYITDRSKYVLQRMIRNLIIDNAVENMGEGAPESLKSATILIATLPILLVYPFAQKYFIKGVMVGAVKG